MGRSASRQRGCPDPARPPRRHGHGGPGGRRQDLAGRGRRADRRENRRRAAVRRGADQDGAGVGPAQGRGRPLRAVRPAAAARHPLDAARLPARPPRPPRPGQGSGADRRRDRPRVLPRAARRGRRPAGGGAANRARPTGLIRAGVPPRRPRPTRPTASSTRWSRTPPTARCSNPAASNSTPAS